jgi:hypothetical protein
MNTSLSSSSWLSALTSVNSAPDGTAAREMRREELAADPPTLAMD